MDYWANVDAVTWFVSEVWPGVLARQPQARFLIVGARPAPEVLRLARASGVEVLGRVADVRPYLAGAGVVVAPLRIARGVQNKVLEGLAMARPIVATRAALTGLDTTQVPGVRCRDDAAEFGRAVAEALDGRSSRDNPDGRKYVLDHFSWAAALEPLLARMEQLTGAGARS
jgi:glycosyltransferase involved in cell wall biosynthesis